MADLSETLAAWKATTDAATPGEWRPVVATGEHWFVHAKDHGEMVGSITANDGWNERQREPDAVFIALSRTIVPALLSAVENVLALCDRAQTHDFEGHPVVYADTVRKALTDALGDGE